MELLLIKLYVVHICDVTLRSEYTGMRPNRNQETLWLSQIGDNSRHSCSSQIALATGEGTRHL